VAELMEPRPSGPGRHSNGNGSTEEHVGRVAGGGHADTHQMKTYFDEPSLDYEVTDTLIDDGVRAELVQIADRYPQPRSALLPMLHLVQSVEGRVTPAGIEACADILGLSTADVSGVATFYTMYKRKPVGKYHVGVCTTALCAVLGGDEVFSRLQDHLGVGNDETTEDGLVTLEHLECNAACDMAPVMMVNWEFFDQTTPQRACEVVDALRAGDEVSATRGARVVTWQQAERVLAGFPDGRADEGPTSGLPSRLGLRIAAERGWSAPDPADLRTDDETEEAK
jgi:NADH-quinone oxidoreductase subunit E